MNGKEEEIYDILYKKKEINDKTPKLRTEDEKKKLKNLSYKISKIPKNLIDNIITKYPSLQKKPQTSEERKEQEIYDILYKKKEINDKTPKLRTEDEKKRLKNLCYKISKIPKNLIDNIITKFPSLQRKPQTLNS